MGISRTKQVGIYVGKNFRIFKNEHGWKVFIFALIISVIISAVLDKEMFYLDSSTWSGFFTLISACIWIGIFNSIQSICKERAIIKREHRTGLHISAYISAHLIYQAVICLVEAAILLGVSALFHHYPAQSLFGFSWLEYYITYFLVTFAADVLGLAVSSIVHTPEVAMTVMPFVLIIQLVFSGALFTLNGPLNNISACTISRWGLNAACTSANYNELESAANLQMESYLYRASKDNNLPVTQDMIEKMVDKNSVDYDNPDYTYSLANLSTQWGILLVHIAVYTIVAVISLEFIDRDKR